MEQGIRITKHSAVNPGHTQERLGITLTLLLEDPEGATVSRLAAEAAGAAPSNSGTLAAPASGSLWIAPAPATVRMRLFCLPYAGGVSENVYARRARLGSLSETLGLLCLHALLGRRVRERVCQVCMLPALIGWGKDEGKPKPKPSPSF